MKLSLSPNTAPVEIDAESIKTQSRKLWNTNQFLETGHQISTQIDPETPWVPYETYMRAQLIDCIRGQIGRLIVDFPANASEDNELHVHPISDRVITILGGEGEFIAYRNKQLSRYPLAAGTRVWMPRGVLHTFMAGKSGLTVESIHNPFVEFDDPKCLVYPKGKTFSI